MYKFIVFLLFSNLVNGYDFYKNCNFKRIHVNEPKIFENMENYTTPGALQKAILSKQYGTYAQQKTVEKLIGKVYEGYQAKVAIIV